MFLIIFFFACLFLYLFVSLFQIYFVYPLYVLFNKNKNKKRPEICTLRKSVTSHELVSDMEAWTINVFFGGQPSCKCHRVLSKRAEIFWIGKHIATLESPMRGLAWRSSAQTDNIITCPANRPTKTLGWTLTGKHAVTFTLFFSLNLCQHNQSET